MPKSPQPSGSSKQLKEYLEIIAKAQESNGTARRWDVYKRAMNGAQTDRWISYMKDRKLIAGDETVGYTLTVNGKDWLEVLRKHSDLVAAFTTELTGDRMRRYDK